MYCVRVNNQLSTRIDAEFYSPSALKAEGAVRAFRSHRTFGDIVSSGYRVVYHGIDPVNALGKDERLSFLAPSDVDEHGAISFLSCLEVPGYYAERYPKGIGKPGELLIEVKGNVAKVAVLPSASPRGLMISGSFYKALMTKDTDTHFVLAFFKSSYGTALKKRLTSNSIIDYIAKDDLYSIPLPHPDPCVQNFIGEKVRHAERLRELSRSIERRLKNMFSILTDNLPSTPKAWRAAGRALDTYRLNPSHYDPVVLGMMKEAKSKAKVVELGDLLGDRGISGGATPLGADYRGSGVFFVRVQNVKPYRLDLSDAAYLSADQDKQLVRSRCSANDIVFSITGYPGTASLVTEEDLPVNLNQHCVRFDIRAPYDAAYIVAAMNSPFVKRQVDRLAIGGTREALDYPSVRSLLIPILDDSVMGEVSESVRRLNHAERFSQRLVVAAKMLTEGLIEGKITESELIRVQNAIENGYGSADRDLLQRLTASGIDVPGAPKLFSDLNALYRTLEALGTPEAEWK